MRRDLWCSVRPAVAKPFGWDAPLTSRAKPVCTSERFAIIASRVVLQASDCNGFQRKTSRYGKADRWTAPNAAGCENTDYVMLAIFRDFPPTLLPKIDFRHLLGLHRARSTPHRIRSTDFFAAKARKPRTFRQRHTDSVAAAKSGIGNLCRMARYSQTEELSRVTSCGFTSASVSKNGSMISSPNEPHHTTRKPDQRPVDLSSRSMSK
jgi:hypothetical protein